MEAIKMRISMILGIFLACALVFVAGCETDEEPTQKPTNNFIAEQEYNPAVNIKETSFSSEEEYISFIKNHQGGSSYYGMAFGTSGLARGFESVDSLQETASGLEPPESEKNLDYSETNVQVIGVDEGDILKTDGNYIYTITEKTLFIIKAYPGEEAEVISTLSFDDYPKGLFIEGDKLAVFGDITNSDILADAGIRVRNGMTFFNIYDIDDRENPSLEKEFKFEGRYHNSRMIENNAYLITNIYPQYRIDYPTPIIMEGDSIKSISYERIYYFNIPYRNPNFVGIHSINIDSNDNLDSKILAVEGNPNLYMSKDNMFITYTERINEWELREDVLKEMLYPELPDFYKSLITKIENADPDVLSSYEKRSKILQIIYEYVEGLSAEKQEDLELELEERLEDKIKEYEYFEYTVINKVKVNDGKIDIDANGKAPGSILNQFSMDEYDNVFRIGTTLSARWSRIEKERTESSNNVYAFDENLKMLGKIEEIAEGERIYSTRFIGERLYMVTFKQIDPFFVIDLSNPAKPKSLGELKIPGFSRYLHPYDKNTIIGIGRDTTEQGAQRGLKISLFDVSDVSDPKEIAKYVSSDRYSQSTAEWEHKAFLFSKEKNLLVIPVANYNWRDPSDNYNGAFVFDITKDDIDLRGLIDHSSSLSGRWYSPSVERSLYIEELLYTKSPYLLRINRLEDLNGVKDISLDPEYEGEIPVY
jgi:uncharacterized secreted protein with C-terminal beta-propeller domain